MGLLFVLVGIGGGCGAMARFGLTQATASISKQGVVSLLQTLWLKGILGVSVANGHT